MIYVPGYYQEVGPLIKQAREQGIEATILGGDGFDSPTLKNLAGAKALNNVMFTSHYAALDTSNAKLQKFITDFKAKYGTEPSAFNALGYDTAYFVAEALKNASDTKGETLKNAMANVKGFVGVTGSFDMNPKTHDPLKTAVIISLKDGNQDKAESFGLN